MKTRKFWAFKTFINTNTPNQVLNRLKIIQNKNQINLNAASGIAVREYQNDIDRADFVLFVDKKLVGIMEAKRAEEGVHLTTPEDQSEGYATAKL